MDTLTTREKILADYVRAALMSPDVLIGAVLTLICVALFPMPLAAIIGVAPMVGAGLQTISLIRAAIRQFALSSRDEDYNDED